MTAKIIRILFFTLVVLIPLNLGKHFISTDSYVRARLIDYLAPTLWAQDIIIFLFLSLGLLKKSSDFKRPKKVLRFLFIFLAVFLPSVFVGENITASTYFYVRLVLYVFFTLYISGSALVDTEFPKIIKFLSIPVLLLGMLAIFQWINQGAVFNNYLAFGEQPYDASTFNIARTNVFGVLKIPSYGTFRHPNTFGGFLAVVLFWMYAEFHMGKRSKFLTFGFLGGLVGLVLTFSQVAMAALFLSMVFFLAIRSLGKKGVLLSLAGTFVIFVVALFLPVISSQKNLEGDPSFFRRSNLLKSSYEMLEENPATGVGLNNFTIALQHHLPLTQVLVFNQPVHNAFILVASESGVFALILFLALLIFAITTLLNQNFGYPAVLFVTLLQFIILGSFDHYIYTSHQTQILFWLTLGLALTYTDRNAQI